MDLPTVANILTKNLRDEILCGKLSPGEKINEIQLAKTLDVSRSPIREVLRILENDQLVENIPRKGTFVTEISLKDFWEIYEIREIIETRSIDTLKKKSITHLPLVEATLNKEEHMGPIPREISDMEKLAHLKSRHEFHLNLVESAGNARFLALYKGVYYNILRYHFLKLVSLKRKSEQITAHSEIVEAIKIGDYAKAKKVLKSHIKIHANIISDNF